MERSREARLVVAMERRKCRMNGGKEERKTKKRMSGPKTAAKLLKQKVKERMGGGEQ